MAVMYSYPHAIPALTDMIIGSKYYEDEGLLSKSFYISDIVSLVSSSVSGGNLQTVSDNGNTILVGTTRSKGIDITLSNLETVYQNGISVNIPSQTGTPYPTYYSAPDAYMATINGQAPGSLTGTVTGFGVNAYGADNFSFWSSHRAGTLTSYHTVYRNYDGVLSPFITCQSSITGGANTNLFLVDQLGNTTGASFIKTGGLSTQYLMADGSSTTLTSTNVTTALGYTPSKGVAYSNVVLAPTAGTTALTVLYTMTVPTGVISYGSYFSISAMFDKGTAVSGSSSLYIYVNTTNSMVGAIQIAICNIISTASYQKITREFVTNPYLTGFNFSTPSVNGDSSGPTRSSTAYSFYTNPAYFFFAMQNASAADTLLFLGARITVN